MPHSLGQWSHSGRKDVLAAVPVSPLRFRSVLPCWNENRAVEVLTITDACALCRAPDWEFVSFALLPLREPRPGHR